MTPPLPKLVSRAASARRSMTATSHPRFQRKYAVAVPTMPAPMTMTRTTRLSLLDVPEHQPRRLQHTGNILAIRDRRHVLPEDHVGHRFVEPGLVALCEFLALCSGRGDELQPHLLELLVANPSEPVLAVAWRSGPRIGERITDDDAAAPGGKNVPAAAAWARSIVRLPTRQHGRPNHRLQLDVGSDFAQSFGGDQHGLVDESLVGGVQYDDRATVVTGFLQQLPGLLQVCLAIALGPSTDTGCGRERRIANEHCPARNFEVGSADHGRQRVLLVPDEVEQSLASLRVVERREEVVRPNDRLSAGLVDHLQDDIGI